MKRFAAMVAWSVLAAVGGGMGEVGLSRAADVPTASASAPATRSEKDIYAEIRGIQGEMQKEGAVPFYGNLTTAEGRGKVAVKCPELLVKLAALYGELAMGNPGPVSVTPPGGVKVMYQTQRITNLAMAASLGSEAARAQLAALAGGRDAEVSISGKMGQELAAWLLANNDAAAQGKVLDAIEALGKANPSSNALASDLRAIRTVKGLSPEFVKRIDAFYTDTLDSEVAAGMQAWLDGGAKVKAGLGKPVVLTGKTAEGKDFSTKDYAGKVILVDFWATWCGPCKADLPKIKATYEKYHEAGLEVVGVSCDGDSELLAEYVKDSGLPWVELWDKAKQAGKENPMHPLAREWKLNGIPQMFLIDRNGVLRSVEGRKEYEKMVPLLLEEKAGAK